MSSCGKQCEFQKSGERILKYLESSVERSVLRLFCALVLLFLFSFKVKAGWIEDRDGKTIIHVKVWALPDARATSPVKMADYAVFQSFLANFSEIFKKRYASKYKANQKKYGRHNWNDVSIQLHTFSPWRRYGLGYEIPTLMAIAGGTAPDILYVNFRTSATYIKKGMLYPLDKPEDGYLSSMTKEELNFSINEKIWPVIKRKGPKGKVHVWAKPTGGIIAKVLFYRKDLLDACGVAYPKNDWTWDDLLQSCRKLTDPKKGTYGIDIGRGLSESWYWLTFLWSAGGRAVEYDSQKHLWKATFNSDAAVDALDFYATLCGKPWRDDRGRIHYGYAARDYSARRGWRWGRIGFRFAYMDERLFPQVNPDFVGIVSVPIGPGGHRGGELNSRMQGLFSGIKLPAVRDAAWEYMRYLDSREAVIIRTRKLVDSGLGRFINPKLLRDLGYDDLIRFVRKDWVDTFSIAVESGQPEPYGANCQSIYYYMTPPLEQAVNLEENGELPRDQVKRRGRLKGLLNEAVKITNSKMMGYSSAGDMRFRRIVASIFLIAMGLGFTASFFYLLQQFSLAATRERFSLRRRFAKYKWAYIILAPAVLIFCVWSYLPMILGLKMAFQYYHLIENSVWVGVDNFTDILWNEAWWLSIWNSVCFSLLIVCLTFVPSLLLAIFLNEISMGKRWYGIFFCLPALMTGISAAYLWKSFYWRGHSGFLNSIVMKIPAFAYILAGLLVLALFVIVSLHLWRRCMRWRSLFCALIGISVFLFINSFALDIFRCFGKPWYLMLFAKNINPYDWLGESKTALISCAIPLVWIWIGPGCLVYLVALRRIPLERYEVADIDGAGFFDKFFFVVCPHLKIIMIINFMCVFLLSWRRGANVLAMNGMDPHTMVAELKIFHDAFFLQKFGMASAEAWMLGFILIGSVVYTLSLLARVEFKRSGGGE